LAESIGNDELLEFTIKIEFWSIILEAKVKMEALKGWIYLLTEKHNDTTQKYYMQIKNTFFINNG